MESVNPYQSPDASLEVSDQQCYTPKFFAMGGRIGRARYFCYSMVSGLMLWGIVGALMGVSVVLGLGDGNALTVMTVVIGILTVPAFVFSFIIAKRRFNDLNMSGWFSLLFIVPFINIIIGLYILFARGTLAENKYGLPPVKNGSSIFIVSVFGIFIMLGIVGAIVLPAYQSYTERAQAAE